ncbi:MAG: hypothetical protein AAF251_03805 [Pseudomonadota bacterium]
MKTLLSAICIAPLVLAASPVSAQSSETPTPKSPTHHQADQPPERASRAGEQHASKLEEPSIVSLDELAEMRGGEQTAVSQQTFISDNSGGTIGGDFTAGDVSISDTALSNFNGIGNIVINTGAQSSLQAGLGVSINISD